MRTIAIRATILALIATCDITLTGCAAPAARRPALSDINDDVFIRKVEAAGTKLCDAGGLRTKEQLAREMVRQVCDAPVRVPGPNRADRRPGELYEQCAPGVLVLCRVYKCDKCPNWHHAGEGGGFVLTPDGVCVTTRHMFEGEQSGHMLAVTCDGVVYPIQEILAASEIDDVAVFRIAAHGLPTIPLRGGAAVGEDLCVISHPRHHHYMLTRGLLARRAEKFGGVNGDLKEFERVATPVLQITAEYGIGSSGGPVLDRAGNAIGMVVNTTTVYVKPKDHEDPQMAIRTCIPAERILALLGGRAR